MTTQTHATEAEQIANDEPWSGYLTHDNAQAVTKRLRRLLGGRAFTVVSFKCSDNPHPNIKTGGHLVSRGVRSFRDGEGLTLLTIYDSSISRTFTTKLDAQRHGEALTRFPFFDFTPGQVRIRTYRGLEDVTVVVYHVEPRPSLRVRSS